MRSRDEGLSQARRLWVESGDWAWPVILAGEAIAAPSLMRWLADVFESS
jgi:hypothetical protein